MVAWVIEEKEKIAEAAGFRYAPVIPVRRKKDGSYEPVALTEKVKGGVAYFSLRIRF